MTFDWLERHDHTADDFTDFDASALSEQDATDLEARRLRAHQERAAAAALRPRTGAVTAAPVRPPLPPDPPLAA